MPALPADQPKVSAIVADVLKVVPTVVVKNASASPAGRSIQCRVAWPNPAGGVHLGYVAVSVPEKPSDPLAAVDPRLLTEQALRVRARADEAVAADPWTQATGAARQAGHSQWERQRAVHQDAMDRLFQTNGQGSPVLALLQPVCDEVNRKIAGVRKDGGHHSQRRGHSQKRARKALAETLDFVLASGVTDDEVKEMLKEALVRHVMSS